MARRLHPTPGLVIGQCIVQFDRLSQVVEGNVVVGVGVPPPPRVVVVVDVVTVVGMVVVVVVVIGGNVVGGVVKA